MRLRPNMARLWGKLISTNLNPPPPSLWSKREKSPFEWWRAPFSNTRNQFWGPTNLGTQRRYIGFTCYCTLPKSKYYLVSKPPLVSSVPVSAREVSFLAYRVGQFPSDSKSNRLVTCSHLPVLLNSFEVNFIDSSKMIGNSLEVLNFNRLFLKLNRFISN